MKKLLLASVFTISCAHVKTATPLCTAFTGIPTEFVQETPFVITPHATITYSQLAILDKAIKIVNKSINKPLIIRTNKSAYPNDKTQSCPKESDLFDYINVFAVTHPKICGPIKEGQLGLSKRRPLPISLDNTPRYVETDTFVHDRVEYSGHMLDVTIHELIHALGFSHTENKDSTMNTAIHHEPQNKLSKDVVKMLKCIYGR